MIVKLCLLAIDGGHFSLSDALSNFAKDESECEIVSADTRWRSFSVRLMCIFSGLMRQMLYYDEDYVLCTSVYIRNVFIY